MLCAIEVTDTWLTAHQIPCEALLDAPWCVSWCAVLLFCVSCAVSCSVIKLKKCIVMIGDCLPVSPMQCFIDVISIASSCSKLKLVQAGLPISSVYSHRWHIPISTCNNSTAVQVAQHLHKSTWSLFDKVATRLDYKLHSSQMMAPLVP